MTTKTKNISPEINRKVPPLRFSSYTDEWPAQTLGDIAIFSKGKGISKADIVDDGELECVRYGELYTHYGETINDIISHTNIPKTELVLSEYNDVIIPASGETQLDIAKASCLLKGGVALGGDLNIIKTKHNGVFLSYYLNNRKKLDIASLAQGISVVHLYASQLKGLLLNLPTLPEQQKIASFLTAIDTKINQLTRKKQLLEQYKKGVMQKIFNQELSFKDDKGGEFPEWEEKTFGDIAVVVMGQSPDSSSYNSDGIGLYLIQGNADIYQRQSNPRNWTSEPTKQCFVGDLLLTVRAPVGAVAKSIHNACIGRGICSIRSNANSVNEFLYQFLLSYESRWSSIEQGSTFTAVSGDDIRGIKISVPSLPEQQKISSFLTAIDTKITQATQQLNHTQTYKKGLLQQMFV